MRLLICAPAPVADAPGGLTLDTKFVEGMQAHVNDWGGPVTCVLWRSGQDIPFGKVYDPAKLPFDLLVLDRDAPLPATATADAAVAMISADMPGVGAMARALAAAGVPYVVALEYTLGTRLRILRLERQRSPLRRLRTLVWILRHERAVRSALRRAGGAQFNGYPAFDAYAGQTANPLLYLDNRMAPGLMATPEEMQARADRLRDGAPLRLIHSGRLEPMKGVQDLPGLMRALREAGVTATLDVYGAGSLAEPLRREFAAFGDSVRMHGPVDFETRLVPVNRTAADIFVSCHWQQDPSCTYLEAMGCGLAVAGYGNRMWSRLQAESGAGKVAPLGDVAALAADIAAWDSRRDLLTESARVGLEFARAHDFETEFSKRIAHARALARAA